MTGLPVFDAKRLRVIWAPFPGMQTEAVNAGEFEVGIGGAKGPGKSDCLIAAAVRQVDKERYKALITRETGPQLLELIDRTHRMFPKMASKPAWNGETRRWTWPSGATLKFEAIGVVADVERIMGQEWGFVGQDEAGNVADEKVIDLVQAEIRCPDPTVIRMWRGSANPGKPGHGWWKRRFVTPCGMDGRRILVRRVKLPNGMEARLTRRFIPGTVLDNPIYANDPLYMAQLATLPEVLRKQLLYGDWDAGYGAALDELHEGVHFVRPFIPPEHWVRFGSIDWGFAHNWAYCHFVVQEDGDLFVTDTVRGRRHRPDQIVDRIKSRINLYHEQYRYTHTDTYVFGKKRERDDATPTIAEEWANEHDFVVSHGNTDRKKGLNALRHYLACKGLGPDGGDGVPALRFMDTPGNRWLFEQLQAMVTDESDMEDVLKVDANTETGIGGDDGYDALRLGVASRPPRAIGKFWKGEVRAFSKQSLAFMVETLYRDRALPTPHGHGAHELSTYLTGV